jgi:prepilin-type processing-associated H-X9-DG protein
MERPADIWIIGDASQDPTNLGGEAKATIENHWDMAQEYDPTTAENIMSSIGPNSDTAPYGHIRWRHKKSSYANFVFVDGHVESIHKNNMRLRQIRITGP